MEDGQKGDKGGGQDSSQDATAAALSKVVAATMETETSGQTEAPEHHPRVVLLLISHKVEGDGQNMGRRIQAEPGSPEPGP